MKTHMKSTDRIPARHIRRLRQIRARVAAEAARIIATEGQHNYHAAKKKAAERIGESERLALPSNIEVKEALRAYQNLYGGEQHQDNLDRLRAIAIEAMQLLDAFNPRLVGSVLDGTADEHSRISLHVFCDSPDSMVLHFLENSVPFHQEQRQIRWHDGNHRMVPLIVFGDQPGNELERRILARQSSQRDASEATLEVLHNQQANDEPLGDAEQPYLLRMDTRLTDDESTRNAFLHWLTFHTSDSVV